MARVDKSVDAAELADLLAGSSCLVIIREVVRSKGRCVLPDAGQWLRVSRFVQVWPGVTDALCVAFHKGFSEQCAKLFTLTG